MKFAECVVGNDFSECRDPGLMPQVVGDAERDLSCRQERLNRRGLRSRQAEWLLTQDGNISLGTQLDVFAMQSRWRPDKNKIRFGFVEHSLGVKEVARDPVLIRECRQFGLIASVDGCDCA